MNPMGLLKLKGMWEAFTGAHPKLMPFIAAAGGRLDAGTVIDVTVTDAEGHAIRCNLRLSERDMELYREAAAALGDALRR